MSADHHLSAGSSLTKTARGVKLWIGVRQCEQLAKEITVEAGSLYRRQSTGAWLATVGWRDEGPSPRALLVG